MFSVIIIAIIGGLFGAFVGWLSLLVMVMMAKNSGRPCDEQRLTSDVDVRGTVARWAAANGYRLVSDREGRQTYQKGSGFLTSPMFLEVAGGPDYTFRSYTRFNAFVAKADMALGGGGFMGKLPRDMAKKAQNKLFAELGMAGIA